MPHPVAPAKRRRRCSSRAMRGAAIHMRNSTPPCTRTIAKSSISAGRATTPSDNEKPTAKSCKSAGVAIMTAWVTRL